MLHEIAELGLAPVGSIRHPRYRTAGGEWDGLAGLPARTIRVLTGARILTTYGIVPDVAAELVGGALGRTMTPDDLADWLRCVVVPSIEEARRDRKRAARHRLAVSAGARTYFDYRDTLAVIEGYRSLWHKRTEVWNG